MFNFTIIISYCFFFFTGMSHRGGSRGGSGGFRGGNRGGGGYRGGGGGGGYRDRNAPPDSVTGTQIFAVFSSLQIF